MAKIIYLPVVGRRRQAGHENANTRGVDEVVTFVAYSSRGKAKVAVLDIKQVLADNEGVTGEGIFLEGVWSGREAEELVKLFSRGSTEHGETKQ